MKKTVSAIVFGVMTATALAATAQPFGYGPGSGYGAGYQQGPCAGNPANCPRRQAFAPGAQIQPGSAADPVTGRLDRMAARLGLSAEQKARLEPIFRERQQIRRTQRQAMRDQVSQVLTPEQLARFDQMRGQRGKRRGGCRGGPGYGRSAGYGQGPGFGW